MRRSACVSLALLVLALTLMSCAKPVTLDGQPVEDARLKRVAQAVAIADTTAASVAHFMLTAYRGGALPRQVLEQYADTYGPAVQSALVQARDVLVGLAKTPDAMPQVRIEQALEALTRAVQEALVFAQAHGYLQ